MPPTASTTRLIVGCMTGTSIDALDAALVEVAGRGLDLRAKLLRTASCPLDDLAPRLRALADQTPMPARDIAALARDFSLLHAGAVSELLGPDRADLIAVHGQTVFHQPPLSWQLFNPWPLAEATGSPVVFDLRGSDLAAGGQGAPITPIADWILFHSSSERAIVNLGGFCNVTLLPPDVPGKPDGALTARQLAAISGRDVCACNQLLDAIARARLGRPFDFGGKEAARGTIDHGAFSELRDLLARQASSARSLGSGDELGAWVDHTAKLPAPAVLRTACEAIAHTIAAAVGRRAAVLAGGGTHNLALMLALRARLTSTLTTTDLGIPPEFREAACIAVLGALCEDGVPITLPQVTGAGGPAPISGCWAGRAATST